MRKLYTLICLCFLVSGNLPEATANSLRFGLSAQTGFKFNFVRRHALSYGPWGTGALTAVLMIDGKEESDLSLSIQSGLRGEITDYSTFGTLLMGFDQLFFTVNPEVILPFNKFFFRGGFGIDAHLASSLWMGGISSSQIMDAYYYGNLENKERKIIPYLSTGAGYKVSPRLALSLALRQPLLNTFYKNETLEITQGGLLIALDQCPTSLSFQVQYTF